MLVFRNRNRHILKIANYVLHQSRSVDEAKNSITEDKTAHKFVMVVAFRVPNGSSRRLACITELADLILRIAQRC